MQTFDPLAFPLTGQQLIEASAGTGKTYSIALLYLRLILERRLEVDAILVVTFTVSATEELRGRIRTRLREALDVLEGRSVHDDDPALSRLLAGIKDRREAATLLTDALTRMDEAAIYTIHGFCQRMLQDHAFESGSPFEAELLESEQALRQQIVEDFWRRRFYPVSPAEAAWAAGQWGDPAGLLKALHPVPAHAEIACVPNPAADDPARLRREAGNRLQAVQQAWSRCRAEVAAILARDPCLKRDKNKSYGRERVESALTGMDELAAAGEMAWELPDCVELLAASVMAGLLKGKKNLPPHPFFQLFDAFYLAHGTFLRVSRIRVLLDARDFIRAELERRKGDQAKMSFDDLLSGLDRALAGSGGGGLVRRIRNRFAVALVDEFQDTDPLQYRIFRRIFGLDPAAGLFMIGDPKQAVYSFRGADIFTYIRAKKDTPTAGQHTMSTNYRATGAMVRAVNRLFAARDSFILAKDIPFAPVRAGGRADEKPLLLDGAPPPPLTALVLPAAQLAAPGKKIVAKDRAEGPAAAWCAAEIASLLAMGRRQAATIGDEPLCARDIAVLVRTHHEAAVMRQALRELDIASVYYSRDSVLATDEARQMQEVLAALLEPGDEPQVRNALVTDLFGLDGRELDQLARRELEWARLLGIMRNYRETWQQRGLNVMFLTLVAERRVVRRLLARPDGERRLTNFLHLAELLQEAAEQQPGMDGLLRWLNDQIANPAPEAASQQLRLESDENLVRIVTIHKAKGLEYPVVFLPFPWNCRSVRRDALFTFHDPAADFRLTVDLGSKNNEYYRLAERERLAEDLRLLYVAVTRARYCCYWCWGRISGMDNTALAWLLHRREAKAVPALKSLDEELILADITGLNNAGPLVHCPPCPASFAAPAPVPAADHDGTGLAVKVFHGSIDREWRITSYSQLAAGPEPQPRQPAEDRDEAETTPAAVPPSVFSFPRGPAAGTCLHGLLEQLDFPRAGGEKMSALVQDSLQRFGFAGHWTPLVCRWLADILDTRLAPDSDLCLRRLPGDDRLTEMAFYFSLTGLDLDRFNRVLTDFAIRPVEFTAPRLHGLMKGFIDLVFRFQGRFFLADYKSNYLGAGLPAYRPEQLAGAMAEHRYDLQYLIYTVALHRYLGRRLNNYDYDVHCGGAYYLFLRGMNPAAGPASGIYFTRPPRELIEQLDSCCRGREDY